MGAPIRFDVIDHPPPELAKVFKGLCEHGLFRRHGYVRFDALRSIALASARVGYKDKKMIQALKTFLVSSGVLIESESEKFYVDAERAEVVLACYNKLQIPPAVEEPKCRLRVLKSFVSNRPIEEIAEEDVRVEETVVVPNVIANVELVMQEIAPKLALTSQSDAIGIAPSQELPIQYQLLACEPNGLSDHELEEGMLAILVLSATLQNKHREMVSVKKQRLQDRVNAIRAERIRLDAEIAQLKLAEGELQTFRASADTRLSVVRQSLLH